MRKDIFEIIFMENKENGKINYSKIARQYDCDPRTVKRYFKSREKQPIVRKSRIIKKVTDGFENIIEEKYIEFNAPAIAIYHLLKEKYGYNGSYTTIKTFTHNLKENKIKEVTIRFETNPGLQCQIDWKESFTLLNKKGKPFVINIFLAILGYSRLRYLELTFDRTQPTLFCCLTNAIKFFGGTPKEFLFDNMKTVVDRSRTQFDKPVYNQTFYSFCKDAGFVPKSCLAFKPRTKGKVEIVAKIMDRLKAYNKEFTTVEELKNIIKSLMNLINSEIHQGTKEVPNERYLKEKEYLNPEPNYDILEAYFSTKPLVRKVPKDSLIMFQGNRYSIPPKYISKTVSISLEGSNLSIYYNNNFVCSHQLSEKKINYLPEHYKEILNTSLSDVDLLNAVCENNLSLFDKL